MENSIGITLWSYGAIQIEKKLARARKLPIDGVEVEGDLRQNPTHLRKLLHEYRLTPLSVTPNNVDISSNDEKVRRQAVTYFLDLVEWTKELGASRFCLHGEVGKIVGSKNEKEDYKHLVNSTNLIAKAANKAGVEVVFEVLNRYESYQINTGKEARRLVQEIEAPLKILLDAYHMNIEESNPVGEILSAKNDLGVYHIADSNRQAPGLGHSDLISQLNALKQINFTGPIIAELTASGPNPFQAEKEQDYLSELDSFYEQAIRFIMNHTGR